MQLNVILQFCEHLILLIFLIWCFIVLPFFFYKNIFLLSYTICITFEFFQKFFAVSRNFQNLSVSTRGQACTVVLSFFFLIHFFSPFFFWDPSPLSLLDSSFLYKSKDELRDLFLYVFTSPFLLDVSVFISFYISSVVFFRSFSNLSSVVLPSLFLFLFFRCSAFSLCPLPSPFNVFSSLFFIVLLLYYIGLCMLCIPLLLPFIVLRFALWLDGVLCWLELVYC